MRKRVATLSSLAAIALIVLTTASPVGAQLVEEMKNTGEALYFYPADNSELFVLTVTGPCNYEYRDEIDNNRIGFVLPKDAMDGSYTWSLDATPKISPKLKEILTEARKSGDNGRVRELCREGKLPSGPTSQAGAFSVVEGKIVIDLTPESKRERLDQGKRAAELPADPQRPEGDQLADAFRADDADAVSGATLLASADVAHECVWAQMRPDSAQGR